jgi:hypothetical protein
MAARSTPGAAGFSWDNPNVVATTAAAANPPRMYFFGLRFFSRGMSIPLIPLKAGTIPSREFPGRERAGICGAY